MKLNLNRHRARAAELSNAKDVEDRRKRDEERKKRAKEREEKEELRRVANPNVTANTTRIPK